MYIYDLRFMYAYYMCVYLCVCLDILRYIHMCVNTLSYLIFMLINKKVYLIFSNMML